jgi:hypothetical protein
MAMRILFGAWMAAQDMPRSSVGDRVFEHLVLGSQSLTNVVVFNRTASHVMLSHAGGLTGIPVENLDPATLRRLGYAQEQKGLGAWERLAQLEGIGSFLSDTVGSRENRWYGLAGLTVAACVIVGFYLYTSYLFWVICVRTETAPGISVWLPFFQVIPLLRAARMSGVWVFLLVGLCIGAVLIRLQAFQYAFWCELGAGFLCLALWAAWSVRICRARKKSQFIAILLVIPGINYLALLYLAGSK